MRTLTLSLASLCILAGCAPSPTSEEGIKQAIEEANYCETKDDCVMVGSKCPFDCYIYANKSEADRIRTMVDGFNSTCEYSCIASDGVECLAGKCVTIPQGAAPNLEGNVGTACTSHDECDTPIDYLTRSSCPFVSMCVDGKCAVTCPEGGLDPEADASCSADIDCTCENNAAGEDADCRCIDGTCMGVVKEA